MIYYLTRGHGGAVTLPTCRLLTLRLFAHTHTALRRRLVWPRDARLDCGSPAVTVGWCRLYGRFAPRSSLPRITRYLPRVYPVGYGLIADTFPRWFTLRAFGCTLNYYLCLPCLATVPRRLQTHADSSACAPSPGRVTLLRATPGRFAQVTTPHYIADLNTERYRSTTLQLVTRLITVYADSTRRTRGRAYGAGLTRLLTQLAVACLPGWTFTVGYGLLVGLVYITTPRHAATVRSAPAGSRCRCGWLPAQAVTTARRRYGAVTLFPLPGFSSVAVDLTPRFGWSPRLPLVWFSCEHTPHLRFSALPNWLNPTRDFPLPCHLRCGLPDWRVMPGLTRHTRGSAALLQTRCWFCLVPRVVATPLVANHIRFCFTQLIHVGSTGSYRCHRTPFLPAFGPARCVLHVYVYLILPYRFGCGWTGPYPLPQLRAHWLPRIYRRFYCSVRYLTVPFIADTRLRPYLPHTFGTLPAGRLRCTVATAVPRPRLRFLPHAPPRLVLPYTTVVPFTPALPRAILIGYGRAAVGLPLCAHGSACRTVTVVRTVTLVPHGWDLTHTLRIPCPGHCDFVRLPGYIYDYCALPFSLAPATLLGERTRLPRTVERGFALNLPDWTDIGFCLLMPCRTGPFSSPS